MPFYMRTPSIVMYPKDVVEALRDANGVHADQGPLKDAAGALPVEVTTDIASKKAQPEAGSSAKATAPATSHSKKQLGEQQDPAKMASTIH